MSSLAILADEGRGFGLKGVKRHALDTEGSPSLRRLRFKELSELEI